MSEALGVRAAPAMVPPLDQALAEAPDGQIVGLPPDPTGPDALAWLSLPPPAGLTVPDGFAFNQMGLAFLPAESAHNPDARPVRIAPNFVIVAITFARGPGRSLVLRWVAPSGGFFEWVVPAFMWRKSPRLMVRRLRDAGLPIELGTTHLLARFLRQVQHDRWIDGLMPTGAPVRIGGAPSDLAARADAAAKGVA